MTLRTPLVLSINFLFLLAYAQVSPNIEWQKALGGSGSEGCKSVQETSDGGYIMVGGTDSNDGNVSGNNGFLDIWVVKMDSTIDPMWQKSLGGSSFDYGNSVQHTSDGGYIVAGETWSNDGDVSGNHGGRDFWVVKLDSLGTLLWQKALGGSGHDYAESVEQTSDGGYVVVGGTDSNDGDVSGNHGGVDCWVVKLDGSGNLLWQKVLGGSDDDHANSVQHTTDGGYVVAGYTTSNDGDVSGNHGGRDFWVVKLDGSGNLLWQKALGGSNDDYGNSVEQTSDGGYIVVGETGSNDDDVSGNHGLQDFWVVKLDSLGTLLWQKALGGSNDDYGNSVEQTSDGGYIVAGSTGSNDDDVSGNHGLQDFWVVKLDNSGTLLWQKALGGSNDDYGNSDSVEQTSDGRFVVAGSTWSNDGDVSGNHGWGDFWVVKLAPATTNGVEELVGTGAPDGGLSVFPNPSSGEFQVTLEDGFIESILIADATGREVLRKGVNTNSVSVDLRDHPQGAYLVTARTVDGLTLKKVLIKR